MEKMHWRSFIIHVALQMFIPASSIRFAAALRLMPRRFNSSASSENGSSVMTDPDAPIQLDHNPYDKPKEKCVLCRNKIELDYKNTRLLQQFVSTFSGRVYEQHITGLCDMQFQRLVQTISTSRKAGYMPVYIKDPKYLRDPKLFDPLRPTRPHSFA